MTETPRLSTPEFFRPSLEYPRIPYDRMLTHAASRWPENVAVVCGDVSLTYRELEALANRFAHALARLGVKRGERVCLFMTNCPEYIIAFYAIARIGGVVSPMNPSYREREVEYQLDDSEAVAAVVQTELLSIVEAVRGRLKHLRHVIPVGAGAPSGSGLRSFPALIAPEPTTAPAAVDVGWDDIVALPYSSGTTGFPKGVLLSHKNLVCNNIQMVAGGRFRETDRLMIFLPFYHIYGAMLMGASVYAGATAVLMERFEPSECMRLIRKHQITLFFVVPPVLVMLTAWPALKDHDLRTVRFTMCGAAPLAPEVGRRFTELTGVPVVQGYGLTEASPLTHLNAVYDQSLNVPESVGLLAHDTEQKVVDVETGERTLGPGEVGEICIRGPQVMEATGRPPRPPPPPFGTAGSTRVTLATLTRAATPSSRIARRR